MRGLADARTGQGPSQGRAARRNRRRDRTASERAVKGGRTAATAEGGAKRP